MRSVIKKKTYKAIYRLLDRVSPILQDCGKLCGAACCTCDGAGSSESSADFDMGMYLLPGEEKVFTQKEDWLRWNVEDAADFDFPDSWFGKVYFVRCTCAPHCPRNMRPLQCRTFPLAPHLDDDHNFMLIRFQQEDLPYTCPLISGKLELSESFMKATYTVWKRLLGDPLIFDLVDFDSSFREEVDTVWPKEKRSGEEC